MNPQLFEAARMIVDTIEQTTRSHFVGEVFTATPTVTIRTDEGRIRLNYRVRIEGSLLEP